jgi:hypothetical protein
MKKLVPSTIALLACALVTGCNQQDQSSSTPVSQETKEQAAQRTTLTQAVQTVATDVNKAADATAQAAQNTAAVAQKEATAAAEALKPAATDIQTQAAALTAKAQSSIDAAKKLVSEGKWAEALQALQQLVGAKVTPEQQSLIDTLKAEAQKLGQQAAASKAAESGQKALGNLLQKK